MKRICSTLLVIVMLLGMVPCAAAAGTRDVSFEEALAADLKELGLFKGVSDTNFNLGRAPSRVEALVMLIRVLGKEQEALNGSWTHPFTDVPQWADAYIGYAFQNKLTNGVSDTEFGSGNADARTYLTFVLRALGYSDANGQDFTWSDPYTLASYVGILSDRVDLDNFWRADVVIISYAALPVPLKDGSQTLAEKLIAANVFTREQFSKIYDPDFLSNTSTPPAVTPDAPAEKDTDQKLSSQEIAEKCSKAVFYITCYGLNGEVKGNGSGFFISSDGLAVTNYHVALHCSTLSITMPNGKVYNNVAIISADKRFDLALLKVNGTGFPYLEQGDPGELKQGQRVYAIGSPLGLDNTMSEGIISNTKRVIDSMEYIQISVPIAPGSSGGALLDEYGKVIGITTAGYVNTTGDLNLAISTKWIDKLDKTSTTSYIAWDTESSYKNFQEVVEFGKFTGLQLLDYKNTPLGFFLTYDASDTYDTPLCSARENLAYALVYYHQVLLLKGFVLRNNADPMKDWYETANERVYVDASLKDGLYIYVTVEWVTQYYPSVPQLPDLAWYFLFDEVPSQTVDGARVWTYNWTHYSPDDFLFFFDLYLELLQDEGFTLISEENNSFRFEGHDLSVTVSHDDKNVSISVSPLN